MQHSAHRKTGSRRQCGLDRPGADDIGNAQFIAGVGAEVVMLHQLMGNLLRKRTFYPSGHIDGGQLAQLGRPVGVEFQALAAEVGFFRVCLGMHGNVFARGHGHGACHQACNAGHQNAGMAGAGGGNPDDEAGGGDDAVIGAEHRGAQPAYVLGPVPLDMSHGFRS